MTRLLLFVLVFVLLVADLLGLNLSLAPGLSVKNAILYLIFLVIAIEAAMARNRRFELASVIVPYGLSTLYAMFTWLVVVLVIDYPGYNIIRSAMTLKAGPVENLLVILVFFYGVLNAKDALWVLRMMLWTVMVANVISVMDSLNLPDMGLIAQREDGRIAGPIGESNQYAAFLVLFLPGAVALAIVERSWLRKLAILGAGASGLALLMTVSRGGIFGAVAGGVLALIFLRRFVSGRAVAGWCAAVITIAIAAVGILYLAGYGEVLQHRLIDLTVEGGSHEISSGRTFIWGTALTEMMNSPISLITGFGWDAYRTFSVTGFAPHSTYLGIYFELGIVGLGLVLIAFANVLRVARLGLGSADRESSPYILAFVFGLFGMLVAIAFIDLSPIPWLYICAYTGTALRLSVAQLAHTSSPPSASRVPRLARRASGIAQTG